MTSAGDGFGDALERLKRDGCNVLVTGEVPEPVTARATRKLLGTPTERRERVLVVTDPEVVEPATHLPGNLYPSHEEVTLFDHRDGVRSDHTQPRPNDPGETGEVGKVGETEVTDGIGETDVADPTDATAGIDEPDECSAIRTAVADAVEPCTDGGDPESAEVRVALVTLRALLGRHSVEQVAQLAAELTAIVTDVRGIGHCHLPVADRSEVVRGLAPYFDARVELRQLDGMVPEQRWHIPQFEQRSEWMTL